MRQSQIKFIETRMGLLTHGENDNEQAILNYFGQNRNADMISLPAADDPMY